MDAQVTRIDVAAYAELVVALAEPDCDRAAVLASHGLDEASWEALDQRWQARLSEAVDANGDGDDDEAIPAIVAEYAEAFTRAQQGRARGVLSFERFVEATIAVRRGTDVGAALRQVGVSLPEFLKANEHWMREMAADDALHERLEKALG